MKAQPEVELQMSSTTLLSLKGCLFACVGQSQVKAHKLRSLRVSLSALRDTRHSLAVIGGRPCSQWRPGAGGGGCSHVLQGLHPVPRRLNNILSFTFQSGRSEKELPVRRSSSRGTRWQLPAVSPGSKVPRATPPLLRPPHRALSYPPTASASRVARSLGASPGSPLGACLCLCSRLGMQHAGLVSLSLSTQGDRC